jgi:hypothetical protein
VETLPFGELTVDIWSKIVQRLTNVRDEGLYIRRYFEYEFPVESMIVKTIPKIINEFQGNVWKLLYRGSADGFVNTNFHNKCDSQTNTLTIIFTTDGFIFGGFTPVAWDSSNSYKPDNTRKSFVFSVKNPHNIEFKSFVVQSSSYAIYCNGGHGPTFGNGYDIYVATNCNANNSSSTRLGCAYPNVTDIGERQIFTGQQNFMVKEIEVFTIRD